MSEPLFPILASSVDGYNVIGDFRREGCRAVVSGIPWSLIEPHEQQAQENHGQTLRKLASRGGLSHCEALAILEDRRWLKMERAEANNRLLALVTASADPAHERSDGQTGRM